MYIYIYTSICDSFSFGRWFLMVYQWFTNDIAMIYPFYLVFFIVFHMFQHWDLPGGFIRRPRGSWCRSTRRCITWRRRRSTRPGNWLVDAYHQDWLIWYKKQWLISTYNNDFYIYIYTRSHVDGINTPPAKMAYFCSIFSGASKNAIWWCAETRSENQPPSKWDANCPCAHVFFPKRSERCAPWNNYDIYIYTHVYIILAAYLE